MTQPELILTLTLPLSALPGLSAQGLRDALGSELDESYFTVSGPDGPEAPTTPHDQARTASQHLSVMREVEVASSALNAVSTLLSEQSRALRIQAHATDPDQAHAGWRSDDGPAKHGRLKPY